MQPCECGIPRGQATNEQIQGGTKKIAKRRILAWYPRGWRSIQCAHLYQIERRAESSWPWRDGKPRLQTGMKLNACFVLSFHLSLPLIINTFTDTRKSCDHCPMYFCAVGFSDTTTASFYNAKTGSGRASLAEYQRTGDASLRTGKIYHTHLPSKWSANIIPQNMDERRRWCTVTGKRRRE